MRAAVRTFLWVWPAAVLAAGLAAGVVIGGVLHFGGSDPSGDLARLVVMAVAGTVLPVSVALVVLAAGRRVGLGTWPAWGFWLYGSVVAVLLVWGGLGATMLNLLSPAMAGLLIFGISGLVTWAMLQSSGNPA
ncbi:MAG: hypothetical protein QM656_15110 [Paracoccaceae bacterium]